ncbi:hypothetical protein SAMN04515668_4815 [Hymenobacter arizonensis]|uniref:Uncharacterized protein n=1 Tax=Hymenobacter arizonensis TaxID=1227077 RepID=A0A1I6BNP2_HYMAR|nr:hypothetical protein SAMN04515668_4815 [Hymenobacter arizonensis]
MSAKILISLVVCTTVLVGLVLWHYPPGQATDPDNGVLLGFQVDVPRLRLLEVLLRTSVLLLALPVVYATPGKPSARRLWVFGQWFSRPGCSSGIGTPRWTKPVHAGLRQLAIMHTKWVML